MKRLILLALVGLLAGCASDDPSPATNVPAEEIVENVAPEPEPEAPETYDVVKRTETFVDSSRPTTANGAEIAPDRTLVTDIYVPEGEGPFPLVVIAHGYVGHARKFTELAESWAQDGYVVAVPTFPVTNDEYEAPDIFGYVDQPADVSFVIDEVLASESKADGDRIGLAGLSLGGATTYGVMFNPCCVDERIDAAIVMSGFRMPFDGDADRFDPARPLMVVHGTTDEAIPYEGSDAVYRDAPTPKYYVTFENGSHASPFENSESPHDEVATAITRDFWKAYLLDDADAADALIEDATADGLSHLEYELDT